MSGPILDRLGPAAAGVADVLEGRFREAAESPALLPF
jgi:hypothetical protein